MKPNLTGSFKELDESVLYTVQLCGGIENIKEEMQVDISVRFMSAPDYVMTIACPNTKGVEHVSLLLLKDKI